MNNSDVTRYITEINSFIKVQCYPAAEARIQLLENSELDEPSILYLRNVHKITASCCKLCVEAHKKLLRTGQKQSGELSASTADTARTTYLPSILQQQAGAGGALQQSQGVGIRDLEASVAKLAGDNEALRAQLGQAQLAEKKASFSAIQLRNKFAELIVKNQTLNQQIEQLKIQQTMRPVQQQQDESVQTNLYESAQYQATQTDMQTAARATQTERMAVVGTAVEQMALQLKQEIDFVKKDLLQARQIKFEAPEELNTALGRLAELSRLARLLQSQKAVNQADQPAADVETQTETNENDEFGMGFNVLRDYLASIPVILRQVKLNMQQTKEDMLQFTSRFEQLANEGSNGAQLQLALFKKAEARLTDLTTGKNANCAETQQFSTSAGQADVPAIGSATILPEIRELKWAVNQLKSQVFGECGQDMSISASIDALEKQLLAYTASAGCLQTDHQLSSNANDGSAQTELSFLELFTAAQAEERYSANLHAVGMQTEGTENAQTLKQEAGPSGVQEVEAAKIEELQQELASLKQRQADYTCVLESVAQYADFTARQTDRLDIALARVQNIGRSVQLTERTLNEVMRAERRQYEREMERLLKQLESEAARGEGLTAELQQARAQFLATQQQIEAQTALLAGTQSEFQKCQERALGDADRVQQLELEAKTLQQSVQSLKQELGAAELQIQRQTEENQKVSQQCADLRQNITDLRQTNAELERAKTLDAALSVDPSAGSFQALQQLVERQKEAIKQQRADIAQYQMKLRETRRLALALEAKDAEISDLQAQLIGARVDLDSERRRAAEELDCAFGEQQHAIHLTEEIRQLEQLRLELIQQINTLQARARAAP